MTEEQLNEKIKNGEVKVVKEDPVEPTEDLVAAVQQLQAQMRDYSPFIEKWRNSGIGNQSSFISPATTKGDLITRDSSAHARLPVGVNDQVLMADSAEDTGLKWADLPETTLERVDKTVTPIGSFAVGDLLVDVPTGTGVTLYRTVDSASPGWGAANTFFGTNSQEKYAIKFKAPFNFTLKSWKIYLEKDGTPTDNVTCKLYSDSGGSPNSVIATSGDVVNGTTIDPSNASEFTFTFNQALTGGTAYWIVMDRDSSLDNTNFYQVQRSDGSDLTSNTISSAFPEYQVKILDDGVWGAVDHLTFFTITGDITSGYQKHHGVRSNIVVKPVGVVSAVDGSDATMVLGGYVSGLSGGTEGAINTIGNCKVGLWLSATELLVFLRKSFTHKSLVTDCDGTFYFPLGFRPLTTTKSVTGTVNLDLATVPGEVQVSGGGNGLVSFSDEYEAI